MTGPRYDDAIDYDPGGSAYLRVCRTAELWQRRALAAVAVLAELAERDPSYTECDSEPGAVRCSLCEAPLPFEDWPAPGAHRESCPWRVAYEATASDAGG